MAERGSGFDMVSAGEFYRVLQPGDSPEKTVFAGVGKTNDEIEAGFEAGGLMFNVESQAELEAIVRIAASIGKVTQSALIPMSTLKHTVMSQPARKNRSSAWTSYEPS
jgi:diaminopimelate decarboxylase